MAEGRERADRLLVARGLAASRAQAQAAIAAGGVRADGAPVTRASALLPRDCRLEAQAAHPYVGRGALKLKAALALWPVAVEGKRCLDVGASTGGFTEVLLEHGAAHVLAVDVGRDQLHPRLRDDGRATDLSPVDARALTAEQLGVPPELLVSDVSFISLTKALPTPLRLMGEGAEALLLVKPQFELSPAEVGRGGLVRDGAARLRAVTSVAAFLESSGWRVLETAESPVAGGDGAVEHLLWARRG